MQNIMPVLDLDNLELTDTERKLVGEIVKPDGSLYASKPMKASGEGKYLWRMVAFGISPNRKHHCIPVTADFDIDGDFDQRRKQAEALDELADRVEKSVPVQQRYGTMAWGRALGYF